jgi:hypothetical protein
MGAVILLGVTIVIGLAAFAWSRSTAVASENSYGNAIGSNINYLKENFNIVNVNFSSTNKATVWFYNTGNVTVTISQLWISNSTWSEAMLSSPTTISLPIGQVTPSTFTINTQFTTGGLYQFKALGKYGNIYTFQQTR